jgi:phosphoribosylformylglycinamidine synthase
MAKIVVDVMLKPEILDPQGKAVAAALPRLGEPTAAQLAEVEKAAEKLLSNPVIENFTVRVEK